MSEEEEKLKSRPRHVMRKDRPWLLALTLADLACGLALVSGGSCLVLVYGARSPAVDTSERGPTLVMDPLALAWPTYVLPGAFLAASGLALLAQALVLAVALWPDCGCGGRCRGGRCGGGRCRCVFQRPRRELRDMAIDRGVVYRGTEQRRRPHSSPPSEASSSDSAVVVVRTIATQTDENQEEEKEEEKTPPPPPPPPVTRKKAKKKRGRRMEDRSDDDEEFNLFSESEGSDQEDGGFFRYLW